MKKFTDLLREAVNKPHRVGDKGYQHPVKIGDKHYGHTEVDHKGKRYKHNGKRGISKRTPDRDTKVTTYEYEGPDKDKITLTRKGENVQSY